MFLNKLPKSKQVASPITSVFPVNSGKGCIARTELYEVFLWEGSRELENLLSAIAVYCDVKESIQIWVIPNSKKKAGFELEARECPTGYWVVRTNLWEYVLEEETEGNPLLKPRNTPYSPVIPDTHSVEVTEASLKTAASFAGRIVPDETEKGAPEAPRPSRANKQKGA